MHMLREKMHEYISNNSKNVQEAVNKSDNSKSIVRYNTTIREHCESNMPSATRQKEFIT
jgi:hypothetical protein